MCCTATPSNKALQLTANPLRGLIHLRKPFRAPPTLPKGGIRKTGSGAEQSDDRFPTLPRLSVEGGAFVGREPTVGPTWATERGLYKRARDGPGGTK